MRILITGSEGALGGVLKTELRLKGHDVWGCAIAHSEDPQVIRADVTEMRQVQRLFDRAQPELVYHFAAEFGRKNGQEYYEHLWRTNCVGTRIIIDECVSSSTPLIFASSSEAYGLADKYVAPDVKLTEGLLDHHPPTFHNEYALTKWTNERQIYTAAVNEGLRAIVLRFFNVYGPGERFSSYRSVACQFLYRALKGTPITVHKNSKRSHLYVADWADTVGGIPEVLSRILAPPAIVWPGSSKSGVPVFNIGSDEHVSNEALLDKVLAVVGLMKSEVTYLPAESANIASKNADCTLAKYWLGHHPEVSLEAGLEYTREWMRGVYGL